MEYKIIYCNGKCSNSAHSRVDVLQWLALLHSEEIVDIQKIRGDGLSVSVMASYRRHIERTKKGAVKQ